MMHISFEEFKNKLLYHRIVEWNEDTIILDNGIQISVEMTDYDCCAYAHGNFSKVQLDAAITDVSDISYDYWQDKDDGEHGCCATVKMLHNRNLVCEVNAEADAGNGGYYYSIAEFIIHENGEKYSCFFVASESTE